MQPDSALHPIVISDDRDILKLETINLKASSAPIPALYPFPKQESAQQQTSKRRAPDTDVNKATMRQKTRWSVDGVDLIVTTGTKEQDLVKSASRGGAFNMTGTVGGL